jgi:hypothetical protein
MELKPIAEFKSCSCGATDRIDDQRTDAPKNFKATEIALFIAALTVWLPLES